MLDYLEFISKEKSMLISPAGYGKTHTIAECLKYTQNQGKQLILTHTHAGVASIKEKIKKEGIPNSSYHVETITSFAQKYVLSFYTGTYIHSQEDSKNYYPFILEKAIELFKLKPVRRIVLVSYKGLFVDEYQDCTIKQHELIKLLSGLFPTHILGDFLQGIFGFNGEQLVDMENATEMGQFAETKYDLDTPQRWINGNNVLLGDDLKNIRERLINKEEVDLTRYPSIELNLINEIDLYNPQKDYHKKVMNLLKGKSLLIIHPDTTSINPRVKIIQTFHNGFNLVESIDDKDFYNLSKEADLITKENLILKLTILCFRLFNKSVVGNWFNDKGFKRKTKEKDKNLLQPIENKVKMLEKDISFSLVSEVLNDIKNLPDMKCYRRELFNSFCKALEEAEYSHISVMYAMVNHRNLIRRIGRKILGRCIGTTLLTKGLEFDTVAILNAHKFDCPKHLYVAMTRASKRLIIFTADTILKPYNTNTMKTKRAANIMSELFL